MVFRVVGYDADWPGWVLVDRAGREREGRLKCAEWRQSRRFMWVALVWVSGDELEVIEANHPHPEKLLQVGEFVTAARG